VRTRLGQLQGGSADQVIALAIAPITVSCNALEFRPSGRLRMWTRNKPLFMAARAMLQVFSSRKVTLDCGASLQAASTIIIDPRTIREPLEKKFVRKSEFAPI